MIDPAGHRAVPPDRAAVEQTARELVLAVVRQRTPPGISIAVEGAPGIGQTFLARVILESVPPGQAKVLRVAGEQGRRNDPFAGAGPLLGDMPSAGDPGEAAFDRVDEICADGPVVLYVDDAHNLDAATLTLIRPLVWASQPAAGGAHHDPAGPVTPAADDAHRPGEGTAVAAADGPDDGRTPGARPDGPVAGPAAAPHPGRRGGNSLFVAELLRAYQNADALADVVPDLIEARFELDWYGTGLEEVIRAQLGQLDEPARDVLAAMAVWGTDVGAGDLARPPPGPDGAVDEPLERAILSGLVCREPGGTVRFSHDLFCEVTYGELAAASAAPCTGGPPTCSQPMATGRAWSRTICCERLEPAAIRRW